MGGLGLLMRRRAIQAHPTISEGGYILSADKGDPEVFRVLMEKGVSSDGVGITKEDAAKVTSISTWFQGNKSIVNFNEYKYFTKATSVPAYAFYNCSALESISFPESITLVGAYSFKGCSHLTGDINLPNATKIDIEAFPSTLITSLNVPKVQTIAQSAFYGCKNMKEAYAPNVSALGGYAFFNCSALQSLTFGDYVTSVGAFAFKSCTMLGGAISLPVATKIGDEAFYSTLITSLNAPKVQTIALSAFYNCKQLVGVYLSEITNINGFAFYGCTLMNALIIDNSAIPTLGSSALVSNNTLIYVPDVAVEAYKADSSWSSFASRIKPLSEYQG